MVTDQRRWTEAVTVHLHQGGGVHAFASGRIGALAFVDDQAVIDRRT